MSIGSNKNQKALEFLKKHPVGVLATVDPNGNPHATVIFFSVSKEHKILFLTKSGTKKADNLNHNDHAMLVAFEAETQTTVQVTGEASEVKDNEEINETFAHVIDASIDTGDTTVPPIAKLKEGDYMAFKLKPKQIRIASFKRHKGGEYEDVFKTT